MAVIKNVKGGQSTRDLSRVQIIGYGLFGLTLLLVSCVVDYQNPNLPGASVPCAPTSSDLTAFYAGGGPFEAVLRPTCAATGCHTATSPKGSYGITIPTDDQSKLEVYCYHFSKWDDETLIDVPMSSTHGGGQFSESSIQALVNWVRNRYN